jgi:cell division protein FtsL
MKRHVIITGVVLLALVVVALFQVKHNVQNLKRDLAEINKELAANQDSIHVLNAEWAYLNEPARIKRLSDKYLTNMNYSNYAQVKRNDDLKTVYLASKDSDKEVVSPATPTLKPILSSVRIHR